jgi:hypothetical protein
MPPTSRAWRPAALASLAVCLAAALPYLQTLHNYFVADDFGVVQILASKPATYFPRWFVSSWMDDIWGFVPDEVRPFPAVTYQLTAVWGAASPVANHVVNIAFHAANGLLVLGVARLAARLSLPASTFAALVFVLLPVHAESVAWITGRVDTIPAFFYMASFLAYVRWRAGGSRAAAPYVGSLVLFFLALFSKQNTVTMVATLALYDLLVARRPVRTSWSGLWPYVPFGAMTAGYLLLRFALFGEVAREGQLTAEGAGLFWHLMGRHARRTMFGDVVVHPALWVALALALALVAWLAVRGRDPWPRRAGWSLLYFGPLWWAIGVAPIAVAGYESPRHVYLAAMGWPIVLGLALQAAWHARGRAARPIALAVVLAALGLYAGRLHVEIGEWNTKAAVSQRVVLDVEREALAAPEGALLIVGAPVGSWEWAIPFALQPPFTSVDLTTRVFVISPNRLHCCRGHWMDETSRTIAAWSVGGAPRIVALHWDARTGAVSRRTDADETALRDLVMVLPQVDTPQAMEAAMQRLLHVFVAGPDAGTPRVFGRSPRGNP